MFTGKRLIFYLLLSIAPAALMAQTAENADLTGLWTGLMFNDTTQLNYRYELVISEKNGRLTGYSQTFFINNGQEYFGLKKLKITREENKLITQDMDLIDNNYPVKPPKGVYVLNVLNVEAKDSIMMLRGLFTTNRTKLYSPVTGYVHVEKKSNINKSELVARLDKLGLAGDLSFVKTEKPDVKPEIAKAVKPEVKPQPVEPKKEEKGIARSNKPEKEEKKPVSKKTEKPVAEIQKTETAKQPVVETAQAAADIKQRVIETIQSVTYQSDSLVISLYDNGEVDGDTVSVLLNGQVIMPMVGLSTNAVRKTIYTKDLPDSVQIVMYAETLGSLPPNTGLLIVNDGKERYEIRFSGDLKRNAAIVFRRKEN